MVVFKQFFTLVIYVSIYHISIINHDLTLPEIPLGAPKQELASLAPTNDMRTEERFLVKNQLDQKVDSLQTSHIVVLLCICFITIYGSYKINRLKIKFAQTIDNIQIGNVKISSREADSVRTTDQLFDKETGNNVSDLRAKDLKWLENFDEMVKKELSNELLKPIDLAERLGICERQLQRKLKKLIGMSPTAYIKKIRLETGYQHLLSGDFQTISEVAYKVGYKCPDYFTRCFKRHFNIKPYDVVNA